jgi:hypothetical protein
MMNAERWIVNGETSFLTSSFRVSERAELLEDLPGLQELNRLL